jgi:hypothetical protein
MNRLLDGTPGGEATAQSAFETKTNQDQDGDQDSGNGSMEGDDYTPKFVKDQSGYFHNK